MHRYVILRGLAAGRTFQPQSSARPPARVSRKSAEWPRRASGRRGSASSGCPGFDGNQVGALLYGLLTMVDAAYEYNLDFMPRILEDKSGRLVTRIAQSLATSFFLPVGGL